MGKVRRSYADEQYPAMVRCNRLRASDARSLRDEASGFGRRPLISVLLAASGAEPRSLERGLDSVLNQVYPRWELCVLGGSPGDGPAEETLRRYARIDERIKVVASPDEGAGYPELLNAALSTSRGEFVALLGDGDALAPEALFELVKLLQERPAADLVYSDRDEVDGEGNRANPYFKPGWSPDLLLSADYLSGLAVYRRSLLEELGGFRGGLDGGGDYDLALRATERTTEIHHVPKVLYHRRATADATVTSDGGAGREGARRALSDALERRGLEGSVEDGGFPGSFRARLRVEGEPKVSIVIPTRDNVDILKRCVEGLERLTDYGNYEILIVDNDSKDPGTVEYLASIPHRVVPFREPFNYSRINNFAVAHAGGEYVLLLNDDTEVTSGGWLEAMLEHAQRPEVGAVGAKLLYPDGRVQHAGVVLGIGNPWGEGVAMHSHQFFHPDSAGYRGTLAVTANYSAVTAACVLLRKSVFEEVGGLDEENLPVQFNDVDLCLRLREKGYSVVYTPHAELLHHESVSRGHYSGDPRENLYMRERWGSEMDGDPFYNPNFSRAYADFNIRADLLRPEAVRQDVDGAQRPPSPITHPLEYQRHVEARYGTARSSPRTTIVPKPAADADPGLRAGDGSLEAATRKALEYGARGHVRPEQLVWMFGSPRTGSTWLSYMMAELENQERWHEPYVGLLFGSFLYERLEENEQLLKSPAFIMGEPYRRVWLDSIKNFVLQGAAARYPELRKDQYLVVKEPNGSIGAPLMMEATPESRFIFLIRDPRDVVASRLDAFKKGSWTRQDRDYGTDEELNRFTEHLAEEYLKVVSQVQKAYDAHPGAKTIVRYEDLRRDTAGTMKAMYDALGIKVDMARLRAAVAKHSWEQIPEEQKGTGKFFRKAQPGSWEEDLTPEQIQIVQSITGPVLSEHY